jgi:hypothetical protein
MIKYLNSITKLLSIFNREKPPINRSECTSHYLSVNLTSPYVRLSILQSILTLPTKLVVFLITELVPSRLPTSDQLELFTTKLLESSLTYHE